MSDIMHNLLDSARVASFFAYAPFSKFRVGSAVLTKAGNVYTGCNVENSSYGLTICAERIALGKAISEGEREIIAISVFVDSDEIVAPCGACRQFIYEFGSNIEVIMGTSTGKYYETTIGDLLPLGFRFHQQKIEISE